MHNCVLDCQYILHDAVAGQNVKMNNERPLRLSKINNKQCDYFTKNNHNKIVSLLLQIEHFTVFLHIKINEKTVSLIARNEYLTSALPVTKGMRREKLSH